MKEQGTIKIGKRQKPIAKMKTETKKAKKERRESSREE